MQIVNRGSKDDRLVSAACPLAEAVEIHETVNDKGVMRTIPRPEGFEIPAGTTLDLRPGGKHLMLMGLTAPLRAGQEIQITLEFEKHAPNKVQVPIKTMK